MKNTIYILSVAFIFVLSMGAGCTKKSEPTVWIYTSLYKDTIADIQPKLEKDFPGVKFQFYQAGSEEVAAKVQAEEASGKIQADILISSDRFWYEDLTAKGRLLAYKPQNAAKVPDFYKQDEGYYTTLSFPVMVLAYNSEAVADKEAPKTFKELAEPKWKGKVSIGSPLASGTSFTTVAFLSKTYGWDYFKALRKNDLIAEGGNSGVVRRLQSKERPVGVVLLENILRLAESDTRIKSIIPEDGAVMQANVLAIVKKDGDQEITKKVVEWLFDKKGQEAMTRSYMYASVPGYEAPKGAPSLDVVSKNAKPWTHEFIAETLPSREKIKEEFSKIIF